MKRKELLEAHNEEMSQAERIIRKFGGVSQLRRALKEAGKNYARSTIYKWTYAPNRNGTNGQIPRKAMSDILETCRFHGIFLTEIDLDPRDHRVKLSRLDREIIRDDLEHEEYLKKKREEREERKRKAKEANEKSSLIRDLLSF